MVAAWSGLAARTAAPFYEPWQRQPDSVKRLGTLLLHPVRRPPARRAAAVTPAASSAKSSGGSGNSNTPPAYSAVDRLANLGLFGMPDADMAKQLGLSESFLKPVWELPGTTSMMDYKLRLLALAQWHNALRRGVLPKPDSLDWPQEPLRSRFLDTLKRLEMARFTRRHPELLQTVMKQFLQVVGEFEAELLEQEGQMQQPPTPAQQLPSSSSQQQPPSEQQQQQAQGGDGVDSEQSPQDSDVQQEAEAGSQGPPGRENKQEVELQMESMDMQSDGQRQLSDKMENMAKELADKLAKKFEDQWAPVMENLDIATQAFEDVNGLLDGPDGFDSSQGVWQQSGWREVDALRKKLENLRELRELVRALGRGGGKGPLKKAPEQVSATAYPPGVVRSPLQPEETRGLTRSGDLSRMLPFEAHLLAAGWPRKQAAANTATNVDGETAENVGTTVQGSEGSAACRRLFMARRAERMLMSYERTGWVDDEPARLTGRMEIRPAAELGPIIVCLDTSGSMYGAREVVAKAVVLECMRGAHRQQRRCYLYAFSGPGQVMELELGSDAASMSRLLSFLTMSFAGGTDVDAPLERSLDRIGKEEWSLADILMVTDGEIPAPSQQILDQLKCASENLGLEVHGLLVGRNVTEPMEALCTHLHIFKSWSVVEGSS